jgi:hypothetical protein
MIENDRRGEGCVLYCAFRQKRRINLLLLITALIGTPTIADPTTVLLRCRMLRRSPRIQVVYIAYR